MLKTLFVVAHTHWDREWYLPAARFQARLISLVDALLVFGEQGLTPFLLDGQAVVLEDYVAVRPERRSALVDALATGALEAGPWYVLGDNLIPSGEALIRNLEAGRRILATFGANAPNVAYCPDTFGHPAALPMLAQGFGCDVAIVWRGFGGASFPSVDTAWWDAPDKSRVLLFHLPPDGYEFGSALPETSAPARERWLSMHDALSARNRTGVSLVLSGADHHAAAPNFATALTALEDAAQGTTIVRTGLRNAARGVHEAVAALSERNASLALPVVKGELRDSYGYTWTLQGTFATRAHQKRTNARLERALLRDVEPLMALAWLHGGARAHEQSRDGSLTLAQLPALLQHAWRTLLRTHPHDTLCGCSHDDVAMAMDARQRRVAALALELRESAMALSLTHDGVRARAGVVRDDPLLVVRNRSSRARGGVAEIRLVDTLARVRVGPASAADTVATLAVATHAVSPRAVSSVAGCATQMGTSRVMHRRRESPQHYPENHLTREQLVLAWVPEIPPFGVRVLGVDVSNAGEPIGDALRANEHSVPPPQVTAREISGRVEISNGRLTVVASPDGVALMDGERLLERVLTVETVADEGDSYTPSLRGKALPLRLVSVRLGATGPLRAAVHLTWLWREARERIRVRTTLIVDAGAGHLRCDVKGTNARRNHRLQLVWHVDVRADHIVADAAFGPVLRTPVTTTSDAKPFELPPDTMPMHRWVAISDAQRGATMFSDGLAEAHASHQRLAVTLVRAIGQLSRNDLPERPGHAGWPTDIPRAQCRGPFGARLGLMLHGEWNDAILARAERAADDLLLPLTGESWSDLAGDPRTVSGPQLNGEGLIVSAVTLSEDGTELVLRALNVTDSSTTGTWTLPSDERVEWCTSRLDGESQSTWITTNGEIAFAVAARAVVTHRVRRSAQ